MMNGMNGSETPSKGGAALEQLLQTSKKTFTDQEELMRSILQVVWWVKEELERREATIKKHEVQLSQQDSRINALEKELAKAVAPQPLGPVGTVGPVERVPPAVPAAVVPGLVEAARTSAPKSAPTPVSTPLTDSVDLLGDLDFTGGAGTTLTQESETSTTSTILESSKAAPNDASDPLMTSDPWGDRPPLASSPSLIPANQDETRPVSRPKSKAAMATRQNEDSKASPSETSEVAKKPKAMPAQIRPKAASMKALPSQSLTERLTQKAAKKENLGFNVAALAAKAQTLTDPPEDLEGSPSSPPPPPCKAAPEAKSSAPVGASATSKAVTTRPPAKAPPMALLKGKAESES